MCAVTHPPLAPWDLTQVRLTPNSGHFPKRAWGKCWGRGGSHGRAQGSGAWAGIAEILCSQGEPVSRALRVVGEWIPGCRAMGK